MSDVASFTSRSWSSGTAGGVGEADPEVTGDHGVVGGAVLHDTLGTAGGTCAGGDGRARRGGGDIGSGCWDAVAVVPAPVVAGALAGVVDAVAGVVTGSAVGVVAGVVVSAGGVAAASVPATDATRVIAGSVGAASAAGSSSPDPTPNNRGTNNVNTIAPPPMRASKGSTPGFDMATGATSQSVSHLSIRGVNGSVGTVASAA